MLRNRKIIILYVYRFLFILLFAMGDIPPPTPFANNPLSLSFFTPLSLSLFFLSLFLSLFLLSLFLSLFLLSLSLFSYSLTPLSLLFLHLSSSLYFVQKVSLRFALPNYKRRSLMKVRMVEINCLSSMLPK